MKRFILLVCFIATAASTQAQNDSIYFWKNNVMIHRQSIKTADLDSITFRRPVNTTGINIPGPNVTDIDGNTFQSVSNCGLTFTKQNLNVSKYTDGTPIPQVQDPTQWSSLTTGAWCYYDNDPANGAIYGKLYNWFAVVGIYDAASAANPALRKELAPTGWHIPTDEDWTNFINCIDPNANGGYTFPNTAGGKMKETGTLQAGTGLWQDPNTAATNESGFTGLPSGNRFSAFCDFCEIGYKGYFWSSSEVHPDAYIRILETYSTNVTKSNYNKRMGLSIRCIKN